MWISLALSCLVFTPKIDLPTYLNEVSTSHRAYRAASEKFEGYKAQSKEKALFYSPQFFSSYNFINDKKETASRALQGDETTIHSWTAGVRQTIFTGTQAKLYYQSEKYDVEGTTATLVPEPMYYQNRPVLEIVQPLWKNFLGSETQALAQILQSQSLAQSFAEAFRMKQILLEAESTFYRLALLRRNISIRKESMTQAEELRRWANRRGKLELADRSDTLQANANYQNRQIELARAQHEEKQEIRNFNSLRGIASDELDAELVMVPSGDLQKLEIPSRAARREDVLAAEQKLKAERAQANLVLDKYRPNLELRGSIAGNGRDPSFGSATSDSFGSDHPTFAIGVNLEVPLNLWAAHDVKRGVERVAKAAEWELQRKIFDEDRIYEGLLERFEHSKSQARLALELEKTQKEKVENERSRLRRGRSTTFQVLTFEQDYNTSQMLRLQAETELLNVYAQLKTFSEQVSN